MAHEVVIRGGRVVDGTGREPFAADVAIDDGRITGVGPNMAPGRREIDARGLVVTPGFVDIHTHLDAQIGWDPYLTPLSWHGVTTALLGNCGVTFAPCRPPDHELLAGMMETVEDIPRNAILTGLPWSWESYGEYLDALEGLDPAINVAGLVGHCAVRFYAMGERAVDEQPSEADIEAMAEVVGASLEAGARGFSTSRIIGHVLPDGRDVPGTHASHTELVRIAQAVKAAGGGLMQNVLNLSGDFEGEMNLLREEAEATGDRVLFSLTAGRSDTSGRRTAEFVAEMRADGHDINAVVIPRTSGFLFGLVNTLPFLGKGWKRLAAMPFGERLRAIDEPAFVAELVGDASPLFHAFAPPELFWLGDGDTPDYGFGPDVCLQTLADEADETPAETFLRFARESKGLALFEARMFNPNMKALATLLGRDDGFVLPGLGDAGAHVGQVMDSGWCSFVLSHWVKEQKLFSLGEAVRRMTSAPARLIGADDRGRLEPGLRADVNVIDSGAVREHMPEYVHDFPGGAGRFVQRASGYKATFCNGEQILADDEHTGARPGEVLRD
ncbi:MAG: amidohydrolase family protein [Myxococcales bacterium]|nr:amidohydrolase family protein [Myxococcales bacterium]